MRALQLQVQLKEQETNLARNHLRIAEMDEEKTKLEQGIVALEVSIEKTRKELNG